MTVTRKVGSSVRRNRVKRLVREAFRLDPELLPHGIDLVVIAKDGAPTLALADVQQEWAAVRALLLKRCRELPDPGERAANATAPTPSASARAQSTPHGAPSIDPSTAPKQAGR